MNISFHSSSSVSSVQSSSTQSTRGADRDDSVGSATKFQASKPGQLLASLQQLKDSSSPADFKSTVTSMADEVRSQAKSATGREAKMLNRLADKLDSVASTGDLSALQPKGPPPGGAARGARAYPPSKAGGDGDGDADDGGQGPKEAAGAEAAPKGGTDLKAQMDALMQSLIDQVTKAKQTASAKQASSATAPDDAAMTAATA